MGGDDSRASGVRKRFSIGYLVSFAWANERDDQKNAPATRFVMRVLRRSGGRARTGRPCLKSRIIEIGSSGSGIARSYLLD